MASIYSAITGQFGKVWILGSLLPALAAVTLWEILIRPLLRGGSPGVSISVFQGQLDSVVTSLFLAVILSGLLYNLNNTIIRVYEGYYWQDLPVGRWKTARHRATFTKENAHFHGMRTYMRAVKEDKTDEPETVALARTLRRKAGYSVNFLYPDKEDLVLPTRLGNIIRSAERYPSVLYDMDAIALWPRLVSVIAPDYAGAVDQSKISLDFTLNSSLLSLGMAAMIIGIGVPAPPYTSQVVYPVLIWLALALLFFALAWFFYVMSLENALAWGDMIRGAFDLYRFELLKKFGYTETPADQSDERRVWHRITQELLYGLDPGKPPALYRAATPLAMGLLSPGGWSVATAREVSITSNPSVVGVAIRLTNCKDVDLVNPVIVDTLGEGQLYVEGSAAAGSAAVRVEGRNPYRFYLTGSVAPGETTILRYQVYAWPEAGKRS
jgi:hypothetical protein